MSVRRVKPQSLVPMTSEHRRWFWGLMVMGVVVIVVGWILTVRQIFSSSAPQIRETIDQNLDKASEKFQQTQGIVEEKTGSLSEAFELMKAAYTAEKANQERTVPQ